MAANESKTYVAYLNKLIDQYNKYLLSEIKLYFNY